MWLDGFTIDVYLADASGIVEITTLLFAAPNSISIATVPRRDAWPLLETALGPHSDFGSLSPNDVHSVSRLGMFAFDAPPPEELAQMEAELALVIDAARRTSGVLVVTDDRCTDNATPQLLQN